MLYPEAMAHLKEGSTVIWLQTPFSQLEKRKHSRLLPATGNPFSDLGDEPVFNKFICDLHDGRNAETRQTSDLRAVDLIVRQQNSHDGGFVVGSK